MLDIAPVGPRRRTARLLILGLVVASCVAAVAVYLGFPSSSAAPVGNPLVDVTNRPAPTFDLPNLAATGPGVSLSGMRGKPVVINFWASWCFPCQTEMPLLEAAAKSAKGGIEFVGIDTNDTKGDALAFVKRLHISYPVAWLDDPRGVLTAEYGLIGLPTTIFISPSGTMAGRFIGQFDQKTLSAALEAAFGPRG